MNTYSATAYTDDTEDPRYRLAQLPARWALRIDLDYRDGSKVVLIYPEGEMPSSTEQQELMWQLQTTAHKGGFTIVRIEADGTRAIADALGRQA